MEMVAGRNTPGFHMGEEVSTYATLDPKLYTPTEEKPFRGIWVGDYSGHGCEFLLMNQPDNEEPFDERSVIQADDETVEEWEVRKKEERIYRGSIEAIKLTGDPNIPRGEYTFIADDISETGFVRKATEKTFRGARIVKSRGHVAARMFRDGESSFNCLLLLLCSQRLTIHRQIYREPADHGLTQQTCSVLGWIWSYQLLRESQYRQIPLTHK
jgi:hypothetical protein